MLLGEPLSGAWPTSDAPAHFMMVKEQESVDTLAPRQSAGALRFLLPSVSDLLFLIAFWALLIGPLSNRPLADADIGWHIRAGEQILATHSVPRVDSFSSTMKGQPWFAWEWFYDALLGIVHGSMGLNGVVWLAALLMATTFAIVFRQLLARGTGLPVAMPLWLLVLGAASIHVFARPHIVSWLFTVLWFIALEKWERSGAPAWLRWLLPSCFGSCWRAAQDYRSRCRCGCWCWGRPAFTCSRVRIL